MKIKTIIILIVSALVLVACNDIGVNDYHLILASDVPSDNFSTDLSDEQFQNKIAEYLKRIREEGREFRVEWSEKEKKIYLTPLDMTYIENLYEYVAAGLNVNGLSHGYVWMATRAMGTISSDMKEDVGEGIPIIILEPFQEKYVFMKFEDGILDYELLDSFVENGIHSYDGLAYLMENSEYYYYEY